MRRLTLVGLWLLFGPALIVLGQPPLVGPVQEQPDKPQAKKGEKGEPIDKGDGPDVPKESPRLQKIKSLQFDRRPSATLRAWANFAEAVKKGDKEEKVDPVDVELAAFQRKVTLGEWDAVKVYLAKLPPDEGKAGYKQLLQSLASPPRMGGPNMPPGEMQGMPGDMHPAMRQFLERNKFTAEDVVGILAAAPHGIDKPLHNQVGELVRQALAGGTVIEHVVERFQGETTKPKDKAALTTRQAAQFLFAAGHGSEVEKFLPSLKKALDDKDHEGLNLLAKHYLALHAKDKKSIRLEDAWAAIQAILATPGVERIEQQEALKQAVELATKIRAELGQNWLDQSFTKTPQRGMDILATLGAAAAQGIQTHPQNKDLRLKTLRLQKTAVEALLKAAPDKAKDWHGTLTLLASAWLKEAEFSQQFDRSSSLGPRMNRDRYGNMFYLNEDMMSGPQMMQQPNLPQPISVSDVLASKPLEAWSKHIDQGLQAKLVQTFAQLYLKVGEEEKAFPYIEQLAKSHPAKGRELVKEFLNVWTRNHNPNVGRDYTNPYMFMYGYERRSESIPLTRSKQERNLADLSDWVVKLRALKLGDIDEDLLTKAFTSCHSSAEVYRTEAIERVFGKIDQLKPRTLASLAQRMRENLAGLWRQPAEQADKKTNRKSKDIQAEVLRGYSVAQGVVEDGLKKFPNHWALMQAQAALLHDENNYRQELSKSSDYSKQRQQALALFARAAEQYALQVKGLAEDEESTDVLEQWFYASLGACDLKQVAEAMQPDMKQPALIRKAILSLPGESAERHLGKFANQLFTRMSAVNPAVKFRYLRSGFDIVGDHPLAHEARKVYDYKDLVREIKLDVAIDGNPIVGHQQPFGVFVNLKHTRNIERESGGFGKYLQNQNNLFFSYNYGRPTADYRDKFTTIVNEALKEQFDVVSITFQTEKVNSRALPEYGWRYTPYAYLLLKARGPEVDKLPPLRIDLDFLDTSGYVILPIESATLPMDASAKSPPIRPSQKLQITQTLDERQADKGKLLLEVKAVSQGLVSDLNHIVDLSPDGFEVDKITDQGVSVARFDPDSEHNAIVSERVWTVSFKSAEQTAPAKQFRFGKAKTDGAEMTYLRYNDADLATVGPEVVLEEQYGSRSLAWLWWVLGAAAVVVLSLFALAMYLLRGRESKPKASMQLPEPLSPFTVLGLLRRIQDHNHLSESHQKELSQTIGRLEHYYFASNGNGEIDLKTTAETWLLRAS